MVMAARGGLMVALVLCLGAGAAATGNDQPTLLPDDPRPALENYGCIACHGEAEVRIGPSYEAIALRYQGRDEQTREILARKIMAGGAGNWGVVPMVANPQLTLEQARAAVDWILDR